MNGRRQTLLLVAMWGGALISVGALTVARMRDGSGALGPEPLVAGQLAEGESAAPPLPPLGAVQGGLVPFRSYRGDARHTGRTAIVGPREAHLRFAFETGGMIKSQVVVDEAGRLWFGTLGAPGVGLDAPPQPGELIALDRQGRVLLRRPLGADVYSTPLVTSDRVYVGSDADRFFSFTFAGERRFELETDDDADVGATLGPNDVIYFSAGRSLWAIERSGTARFRFEAQAKIYTSPAIAPDGTLYVGAQDDYLYALSPSGEQRWRVRAGDDIDSSPVVGDDGAIFFGSDDRRVHAVEPNGHERFAVDVGGYVRAPIALTHDGGIVAAVMGPRPRVVSLDAQTGAVRFSFALPLTESPEMGVLSGPLVDGEGSIYFGGHDDFIYSLSRTGGLRWAFRVEGDVDAPPMLDADGTLYVGCDDGRLYALAGNAEEAAPEAESTDAGVQAVPSATPAAPASTPGAAPADDDEGTPGAAAGSD
ncbi:MAG: PQQ-like beta-propeller repeat protein [Sandaracinaceae bacterium]|nr:PQQ-like beta-propeller repeat protein [Sandaracinaceae bacterium]